MAVALPYHSQSVRVAARCESPPCQPALRVFLWLAANILTSTAHPLKLNFYNFRESVMMSAMAGGDWGGGVGGGCCEWKEVWTQGCRDRRRALVARANSEHSTIAVSGVCSCKQWIFQIIWAKRQRRQKRRPPPPPPSCRSSGGRRSRRWRRRRRWWSRGRRQWRTSTTWKTSWAREYQSPPHLPSNAAFFNRAFGVWALVSHTEVLCLCTDPSKAQSRKWVPQSVYGPPPPVL